MKPVFILILLVIFTHHIFAKADVKIKKAPVWIIEKDFNKKFSIKDGDVSLGYYDLLIDQQINIPAEQDYRHYILKVLSDTGVQRNSQIEIDIDPAYEKLVLHSVRIIRGNKTLDRANLDDLKIIQKEKGSDYYLYDGRLSVILNLKDVQVGDVLDYSYSVIGRNPIYRGKFFKTFYFGSYNPVDRIFARILSNNINGLTTKHYNTSIKPKVTKKDNLHTLEWYVENVKEILFDDDVPSWYNPFPYVMISEFEDWQELGRWAEELFRIRKAAYPKLEAKINEIKKTASTETTRLTRCLRFVQDEIRYLGFEGGIMAYKPHMPGVVFDRKYGDCKDQSLLLSYMLNKMDISACPALVNTLYKQEIRTFLPTPSAFNHCIVQVTLDDEVFWYDPTRTSQRGDYKRMSVPGYKRALVMKEDVSGLSDIEYKPVNKVEVIEKILMTSYDAPAKLIVNTKFYGKEADSNRQYFKDRSMEIIKKNYANFYARDYDGVEILKDIRYSDDEENNIFSTMEEYRIKNFVKSGDTGAGNSTIEVYPRLLESKLRLPETTIRTMPLNIGGPFELYHTIELHTPETWDVAGDETTISSKGLYYNGQIHALDSTVFVVYTYKILREYLDLEDAAEHIDNVEKIFKQLGYRWDFSKGELSGEYRVNTLFIFLGLLAGVGAVLLMKKLFHYDPPPLIENPEGKKIGGWLYVVAFGLILSLFGHFSALIVEVDFLDLNVWQRVASKSSAYYNPVHAALILFEYLVNLLMIIYSFFVFILFVKKRTSLPRMITFFYVAIIANVLIDNIGAWGLGLLNEAGKMKSVTEVFRITMWGIIWILYVHNSDRVKDTFVRRLRDKSKINKMLDAKSLPEIKNL